MRPLGSSVIGNWLEAISVTEKENFLEFAKRNYHNKDAVWRYLSNRGVKVHQSTVYSWMNEQKSLMGETAKFFNQGNLGYQGVETIAAMEGLFAKMTRIAERYVDVIEEAEEVNLDQAVQNLPVTAREIRGIAEVVYKLKKMTDVETLILSGASRIMELVMNSPTVKDKPEEAFIYKTMEAALLRVVEEVEQEKKKVA